ncbi:MAG: pyruvate kinase [Promethearchaeota archaeon]
MELFLTASSDTSILSGLSQLDIIKGFRFNTGLEIGPDKLKILQDFRGKIGSKELLIDLKCRELRLINAAEITKHNRVLEINHHVEGKTPVPMYFNEGTRYLEIEEIIDGTRLLVHLPDNVPDGFKICFGRGASINMPDVTVEDDYLTSRDREFIEAARSLGIHSYCLSFVESKTDIEALLDLDPDARIIAKIESVDGLKFIKSSGYRSVRDRVRLIAARGDLFIELDRPHEILGALKTIIDVDSEAIAASRLLLSMISDQIPSCADICDVGFLLGLGYRAFLFCDYLGENKEALHAAIGLLIEIIAEFDEKINKGSKYP